MGKENKDKDSKNTSAPGIFGHALNVVKSGGTAGLLSSPPQHFLWQTMPGSQKTSLTSGMYKIAPPRTALCLANIGIAYVTDKTMPENLRHSFLGSMSWIAGFEALNVAIASNPLLAIQAELNKPDTSPKKAFSNIAKQPSLLTKGGLSLYKGYMLGNGAARAYDAASRDSKSTTIGRAINMTLIETAVSALPEIQSMLKKFNHNSIPKDPKFLLSAAGLVLARNSIYNGAYAYITSEDNPPKPPETRITKIHKTKKEAPKPSIKPSSTSKIKEDIAQICLIPD